MGVIGDSGGQDIGRLLLLAAEWQYGVVAWRQLAAKGVPRWTVDREIARGHLLPLHRGVFAVGHRVLTYRGRWMAAVLACGARRRPLPSRRRGAPRPAPGPQAHIDVTAPTIRSHPGIRAHVSAVPPQQRTRVDRIPVTSLERTLLDYAECATPRQLENGLEEAERRTVLDLRKLRRVIDHSPGRKGLKPLTYALANLTDDPAWTQSPAEDLFLELIRATNLPLPRANVLIDGHLVDFAWPEHKVIVEVDGFHFHTTHEAFENDRKRDRRLQKLGWRVIRITYRDPHDDPVGVLEDIRELLSE